MNIKNDMKRLKKFIELNENGSKYPYNGKVRKKRTFGDFLSDNKINIKELFIYIVVIYNFLK